MKEEGKSGRVFRKAVELEAEERGLRLGYGKLVTGLEGSDPSKMKEETSKARMVVRL
jgi:hypothetical protein